MSDFRRTVVVALGRVRFSGAVPQRTALAFEARVQLTGPPAVLCTAERAQSRGRAALMGLLGALIGLAIGAVVYQYGPSVGAAPAPVPVSAGAPSGGVPGIAGVIVAAGESGCAPAGVRSRAAEAASGGRHAAARASPWPCRTTDDHD